MLNLQEAAYIHANALQLAGKGILILGRSGSGKSRLTLDLLAMAARRAIAAYLVGDDRIALNCVDGRLQASAHPSIAGQIEQRGVGILRLPCIAQADIELIVDIHGESLPDLSFIPQAWLEIASKSVLNWPIRLSVRAEMAESAAALWTYIFDGQADFSTYQSG